MFKSAQAGHFRAIVLTVIFLVLVTLYLVSTDSSAWSMHAAKPGFEKTGYDILSHVGNDTLGFQKIFVLNLPSRTDRRDAVTLAAHFADLQVTFMDGVTEVDEKTLPPKKFDPDAPFFGGSVYAWRAHMNILQTIVREKISTALIMEDDVDWDVRIKSQITSFAKASQLLVQPKSSNPEEHLDPTNPRTPGSQVPPDISIDSHDAIVNATDSPYGDPDRWDLLWLGHCGTSLPDPENERDNAIPLGRVIYHDDSVPEPQHLAKEYGSGMLFDQYPAHLRAVHAVGVDIYCSVAFAVSLAGARRILWELGINEVHMSFDASVQKLCTGRDGMMLRCLAVEPQLFAQHRPVGQKGAQSNIDTKGDAYVDTAHTYNIRWSTRVNFPKLVNGETEYIDQYPDGAEPPPWKPTLAPWLIPGGI